MAKAKHHVDRIQRLVKAHDRRDEANIPALKYLPPKRQARHDRDRRHQRMGDSVFVDSMFDPRPVTFPGLFMIPSVLDARLPDSTRIQDLEPLLQTGSVQVYGVDGSEAKGFLGAGVSWQEEGKFVLGRCHLGQSTGGNNNDTKLITLPAALGQAKNTFKRAIAKRLQEYSRRHSVFFKASNKATTVFLAQCRGTRLCSRSFMLVRSGLEEWKASVELIWVKGHSGSASNVLAGKPASQATIGQVLNPPPQTPFFSIVNNELDAPQMWRNRGQDWIDEWLGRANRTSATKATKQLRKLEK
ncbi:hypothetical protein E8E12_005591 [Didymella heteroderae]|uniref:Uncharacterized protein n=1 Tax=Didymella heteroderae TaxID=1769908 RepID=A0A9P5BXT2_9PLEO|nr:hypothetical protein E8E12_005591 [Didymella heteroderae]